MFLASHTQLLLPGTGMGCLDSTTEVKGMGSSWVHQPQAGYTKPAGKMANMSTVLLSVLFLLLVFAAGEGILN